MKFLALFSLLLLFATNCVNGNDETNAPDSPSGAANSYTYETVTNAIDVPWGMTWLDDGSMLVSERRGSLHLLDEADGSLQAIEGVPEVFDENQGGLLDIMTHPDYATNGWIYLTYSSTEGGGGSNTALMRARLNDDRTRLVDKEVLYKAEPNTQRPFHFGSRIVFDNEGHVYFGIGDRGDRDTLPQDITIDGGKIYRLHDDGRIPEDNPFVGKEGVDAAFAYGIRNPQGMALHPETGELWEHEHGPKGGDEINIIRAGKNYGWPVISYGVNYDGTEFAEDTVRAGMEQPEWYWDPAIAPSGMVFVTSDRYPEWQGDILVGSLRYGYIVRAIVEDNTVVGDEILFEGIGRVRDIKQGPDGYLYVSTETDNGIVRIIPENS
ncbi:MAG: PQQ-dependent sugar dehydrogenase [Cyclonatronaceae bacterium]